MFWFVYCKSMDVGMVRGNSINSIHIQQILFKIIIIRLLYDIWHIKYVCQIKTVSTSLWFLFKEMVRKACFASPEVWRGCNVEGGACEVGGAVWHQEEHGGGRGDQVQGANQKHQLIKIHKIMLDIRQFQYDGHNGNMKYVFVYSTMLLIRNSLGPWKCVPYNRSSL